MLSFFLFFFPFLTFFFSSFCIDFLPFFWGGVGGGGVGFWTFSSEHIFQSCNNLQAIPIPFSFSFQKLKVLFKMSSQKK
jgi:hypothetical protein